MGSVLLACLDAGNLQDILSYKSKAIYLGFVFMANLGHSLHHCYGKNFKFGKFRDTPESFFTDCYKDTPGWLSLIFQFITVFFAKFALASSGFKPLLLFLAWRGMAVILEINKNE